MLDIQMSVFVNRILIPYVEKYYLTNHIEIRPTSEIDTLKKISYNYFSYFLNTQPRQIKYAASLSFSKRIQNNVPKQCTKHLTVAVNRLSNN